MSWYTNKEKELKERVKKGEISQSRYRRFVLSDGMSEREIEMKEKHKTGDVSTRAYLWFLFSGDTPEEARNKNRQAAVALLLLFIFFVCLVAYYTFSNQAYGSLAISVFVALLVVIALSTAIRLYAENAAKPKIWRILAIVCLWMFFPLILAFSISVFSTATSGSQNETDFVVAFSAALSFWIIENSAAATRSLAGRKVNS